MSSTHLSCRKEKSVQNAQAEIAELTAETHNFATNSR